MAYSILTLTAAWARRNKGESTRMFARMSEDNWFTSNAKLTIINKKHHRQHPMRIPRKHKRNKTIHTMDSHVATWKAARLKIKSSTKKRKFSNILATTKCRSFRPQPRQLHSNHLSTTTRTISMKKMRFNAIRMAAINNMKITALDAKKAPPSVETKIAHKKIKLWQRSPQQRSQQLNLFFWR